MFASALVCVWNLFPVFRSFLFLDSKSKHMVFYWRSMNSLLLWGFCVFPSFFFERFILKAKERRLTSRVGFIRNVSFFSVYLSSFCDETKNFSVLYLNLKFNLLSINLIACLQRWLILENHLGVCVLNYNWTSDKPLQCKKKGSSMFKGSDFEGPLW